jgi:hypothetical protein
MPCCLAIIQFLQIFELMKLVNFILTQSIFQGYYYVMALLQLRLSEYCLFIDD